MPQYDLHMHTTASDGLHSPQEVVQMAKSAGLDGIAITDHDTVFGIEAAVLEAEKANINIIPGVEISTFAGGQDIHILGLGVRLDDHSFLRRLSDLRSLRGERNKKLIQRFNDLGIQMTEQEVNDYAFSLGGQDVSVGRPHFAALLVNKGVVSTIQEAFDVYLAKTGSAYIAAERIAPEQGIQWIRDAGGIAVIAHPGLYDDDELVEAIIRHGVDGIEVYHSDHGPKEEEKYKRLALNYGLLMTGGSDFHGAREGKPFHGAIGSRRAPEETINLLIK